MEELYNEFSFQPQVTFETFEKIGYGPFEVKRTALLNDILSKASPMSSVHISGCKGAGKTTVLDQLGRILIQQGKKVFMFPSARDFDRVDLQKAVKSTKDEEMWFLVDETQNNPTASMFTYLLKNNRGHKITTIGAGVPEFKTVSGEFTIHVGTERLFLNSHDDLKTEGVFDYFNALRKNVDPKEINTMLEGVRAYVGGTIYPLMWIASQLLPILDVEGGTASMALDHLHSVTFRDHPGFKEMVGRILPPVSSTNIRPLLYKERDPNALLDLRKKGFCNANFKVVSELLFEQFVAVLSPNTSFNGPLEHGLEGAVQLLKFALPPLQWSMYDPFGGPIEDALTVELLIVLAGARKITTRIYNPKLINSGNSRKKPDMYLNSTLDCFIECVKTSGNNKTEVSKLEEHIERFLPKATCANPYYVIGGSDYAILHYQEYGSQPMKPSKRNLAGDIFNKHVVTFLMSTREVFRGNERVAGPESM